MLKSKLVFSILLVSFLGTLALSTIPSSYAAPNIYVYPPVSTGEIGESFVASIKIRNAESVFAWEVKLGWNASLLDVTKVAEGTFLKGIEQAPTFFVNVTHQDEVDDDYVTLGCTRKGNLPGVAGTGTLATVNFLITEKGETTLDLYETKLRNPVPNPIEHTSTDGLFTNIATLPRPSFSWSPLIANINEDITFDASGSYDPDGDPIARYFWEFGDGDTANETDPVTYHAYSEGGVYAITLWVTNQNGFTTSLGKELKIRFAHDIVMYSVSESLSTVAAGDTVTITVKVGNDGSSDEGGIIVTTYYDDTPVSDAQTVPSLASGQNKTLTFNWNTAEVAEGTYRIKAVTTPIAGETSTGDNTKFGGTVTITVSSGIPWMYIGGGIAAVAVVGVAVFMMMRRRR